MYNIHINHDEMSPAFKRIMNTDFRALSPDELEIIQDTVSRERRRKGHKLMKSLSVGDKVIVDTGRKTNRGKVPPTMSGIVREIKRTKVVVDCMQHGVWRVPSTRLTLES